MGDQIRLQGGEGVRDVLSKMDSGSFRSLIRKADTKLNISN